MRVSSIFAIFYSTIYSKSDKTLHFSLLTDYHANKCLFAAKQRILRDLPNTPRFKTHSEHIDVVLYFNLVQVLFVCLHCLQSLSDFVDFEE